MTVGFVVWGLSILLVVATVVKVLAVIWGRRELDGLEAKGRAMGQRLHVLSAVVEIVSGHQAKIDPAVRREIYAALDRIKPICDDCPLKGPFFCEGCPQHVCGEIRAKS